MENLGAQTGAVQQFMAAVRSTPVSVADAGSSPRMVAAMAVEARLSFEAGSIPETEQGYEPSMTRATSPWHSAHLPTSSKSPPLMAPVKLVIVVS